MLQLQLHYYIELLNNLHIKYKYGPHALCSLCYITLLKGVLNHIKQVQIEDRARKKLLTLWLLLKGSRFLRLVFCFDFAAFLAFLLCSRTFFAILNFFLAGIRLLCFLERTILPVPGRLQPEISIYHVD